MRKKNLFMLMLIISIIFVIPKNTEALSLSQYQTRNNCNNRFELAGAHTDGIADFVGCYNSYNEAKNAMVNNGASDLIIFDSTSGSTKIVDANNALLDLSVNPETLTYFYETRDLNTRQYTYMDTGSLYGGVDGALLDVNYNKSVKVMIGGLSAWIKNGTFEIVPLNWVKSSSSYTVNDSIRHNYVAKIQNTYSGQAGSTIGPKPEQLAIGTYYSYDGHYFYKDRLTMLKDYKSNTRNNAVNKNNPYYNYYMFLSNHSKTTYSSMNIDEYIRNNMGIVEDVYGNKSVNNSSRLYGQGTYFYYSQQKYGANALLSLSLNRNESAHGRSSLAINKNNGFGFNAVDSNPYQAANWYPTYTNSILEYAYKWITDGYADPSDSRYFGPVFGDKYIGMNVKYAADTYWSEKMAANYYSFDKAKGMQDYNFYQLGVVTSPTKAYISPSAMATVVYTYPEKDDGVLIVDEVTNSEGTWYKLQSDKIINGTTITTTGDYNWDSYVYVKKEQVTKINKAKNSYIAPNNVTQYLDYDYEYDLYVENAELKPKVAKILKDTTYYYDSTLQQSKNSKVLKDKLVMVYATAYNGNKKPVAYQITSNYMKDQKDWVSADSIQFVDSDYGYQTVNISGAYEWVCSEPIDSSTYKIGGQYTYSYFPIVGETTVNGVKWYKVPVSLSNNSNSYGYILSSEANAYITKYNYKVTNENQTLNTPPVINASNKKIVQGTKIDLLDGVTAKDEEDGDLTVKITVEGTVDIDKPGTYEITYKVVDSKNEKTFKKITITVTENKKPEIIAEDKTVTVNTKFDTLKDVSAKDEEDGNLTDKIEVIENTVDMSKVGEYQITYKVVDSYNQEVTKTIKVSVVKDQDPVINASDKTIYLNDAFDELKNVTATDMEDGDLTKEIKVIENTVNTKELGEYIVIYQVTDSAKNTITKEIKVFVEEKKLEEAKGEFNLESLKWNQTNKTYTISGYLMILDKDNNTSDNKYELILKNKNSNKEYSIEIDSWTKDVPYDLGQTNGAQYKNSWFKGKIDFSKVPSGDYDLYMKATKGIYYTKTIVDNLFNVDIDRRAEDNNKGYSFKVLLSLRTKQMELSIRDELITTSTANTFRNMINDYEDIAFDENNMNIKGTSYNYGGTYSDSSKITRKLILENVDTYEQYTYNIGSTNKGSYKVTSTDNKSKEYAWYNKEVDISHVPKGTYSMLIYTKTIDSEDYGEIADAFGTISKKETTINKKKYSLSLNKNRQNRIELIVE